MFAARIETGIKRGAEIGLVVFPSDRHVSNCEEGRVVAQLTTDITALKTAIDGFEVGGGTPIHGGLQKARGLLAASTASTKVALLFTDGLPSNWKLAEQEAELLKEHARLVVVGIGEDVSQPFLSRIASSPADYHYAQAPRDIFDCIVRAANILFGSDGDGSAKGGAA